MEYKGAGQMKKNTTSDNYIIQFFQAGRFSSLGLIYAFRYETSFRRNLFILALSLILSFFFADGFVSFWLLNLPFLMVMSLECLNTAIEAIVDQLDVENKLMAAAKDCGSAAVAIMLAVGAIMWVHYLYNFYY